MCSAQHSHRTHVARKMRLLQAALATTTLRATHALMYDVLDPHKLPPSVCTSGCARWSHLLEDGAVLPPLASNWLASGFTDSKKYASNQSTVDEQWAAGRPPPGAGSQCATQGRTSLVAWPPYPDEKPGTDTSYCFCANAGKLPKAWGYCHSAPSVPEQINVVAGQDHSVVVTFVTLWEPAFSAQLAGGHGALQAPPRVEYSFTGQASRTVTGATHLYISPSPDPGNASDPINRYWDVTARNYSFHFVKLTGLPEGAQVTYRVASGTKPTTWSDRFAFKAPFGPTFAAAGRAPGETIVDLFGDMGIYRWNNLANMQADLDADRLDAIFHVSCAFTA